MGLVYADLELINGGEMYAARVGAMKVEDVKKIKTKVLVDSGAYMMAINETIRLQLNLPIVDRQIMEMANGDKLEFEIAGPLEVRFQTRRCSVDAVVLPSDSEPLLGAIPMEDMDVLIDPKNEELIVNPAHPYKAQKPMK